MKKINKSKKTENSYLKRRDFVKIAGAGAITFSIIPRPRSVSPSTY